MKSAAWAAAFGLAWLYGASACTTFYGLKPDSSSSSSSTGSGGSGGAPERGLLPKLDAAHLCALVATCPSLGASVVASAGLPLVEIDSGTENRNFNACVDWLTLPLAPLAGSASPTPRLGFDALRSMIVCMAASTSCDDAERCALAEVVAPGDPRCGGGGTSCDGQGNLVDCPNRQVLHCKTDLFAPDSTCTQAQGVTACASGLCAQPEVNCDSGYLFSCAAAMEPKTSLDCAVFGLVCDASAADSALRGCYGAMGKSSCSPAAFGAETCLGTHARTCTGVVNAEVDCAAIGETCVTDAGTPGPARCRKADAACSPYDATMNVCTGTTISVCLDGVPTSVDCAAIGLSCVPGMGGVSAHCG